jgi:L-alanine-DL-glutamate epimerase-like enolase superfamily enzyme
MIKSVHAYLLDIPLTKPYHLSFTDVVSFPAVITVIETADGRRGMGESTALPGYSSETAEDIWGFVRENGGRFPGKLVGEAIKMLDSTRNGSSFLVTPLMTALETIEHGKELGIGGGFDLEIVGIVNSEDFDEVGEIISDLLDSGHKTLKVKVGRDVRKDIEKTRNIQALVGDRAKIRIDANQGFSYSDAEAFVKSIDPGNIELFEQPFGIEEWDKMTALSKVCPVPLMLDESIRTIRDLEMTHLLKCARYVKFKLMKIGSFKRLLGLINWCRERGIGVVLGNGVAGEIGCYHEALLGSKVLDNAGEMNGYLKQKLFLCKQAMRVAGGRLTVGGGFAPDLDSGRLKDCLVKEYRWDL